MKKKKNKNPYPKSFANRLTRRIMLLLFVLLAFAAYGIFKMCYNGVTAMVELYSSETVSSTNKSVRQVLSDVYVASVNIEPQVEASLGNPDALYRLMKRTVELNPRIRSCGISFVENYYPKKGRWFCPYAVRRSDGTVETKTIGNRHNDYLGKEWFVEAIEAKEGYWSKPFFDSTDSTEMLTSYMIPIHDKDGRTVAVLGVDLSLEWLSEKIQKDFTKSFSEIIGIWGQDEPSERRAPRRSKRAEAGENVATETDDRESNSGMRPEINDSTDNGGKVATKSEDDLFMTPYMFIIDSAGTYIAHPIKDRILKKNLFDIVKETPDTLDDHLALMMTKGRSGSLTIPGKKQLLGIEADDKYIFYTPIKHAGWSLGFSFPCIYGKFTACIVGFIFLLLTILPLTIAIYIFGRILIKRSVKPVKQLALSADEVAKGHFDNTLPQVKSHDEIQMLRDSFEQMQFSLKRYMDDLQATTAQKTAIENELKIAHDIQMSMLPKIYPPFPDRNDIDIFGMLKPAKAVGGDLFDFYIRDEQLFFCIGDVSGKGIPAALVMAVMRSLFRNVSSYVAQPDIIVTALNKSLADNNDNSMFATLFVGVFDLTSGRLTYCNAGHNAPLLIDGDCKRIGMLPVEANLPVGIVNDWKFTCQETLIDPQTTIFLYTDGLTEAENAEHQQFQEERMIGVAQYGSSMPQELIEQMTQAVKLFVDDAEQSDDLTMLAIRYTKKHEEVKLQHTIALTNNIDEVPKLAEFVEGICEELGVDPSTTMSLNLALEEAVVNVIDYAYPAGTSGNISITAEADEEQLTFIVSDWGTPFDPTAKEEVDTTLPAEERPIGGLGIHLVRQIMDSINYERERGMNVLTLRKKINI